MSTTQNPIFESALALPDAQRADLAFQLLETLAPGGNEVSHEEFAAELRDRVAAHRDGEVKSFSLDEARALVEKRLAQERGK